MSAESKGCEIIVVPHTHWDREWFFSFQQYRYYLVQFLDGLLDLLEQEPSFTHFHGDGQTVLLEDYLALRPEAEERIRELVRKGRLSIGPWYLQPDEFLVSAEALVRNLLRGHQIARRLGGVTKEGYIIDPFGHIAQLPQLLQGFGIGSAVFMRGSEVGGEFLWEAPDGSEVLAYSLPMSYSSGRDILSKSEGQSEEPDLTNAFTALRDVLRSYASTDVLLVLHGGDFLAPMPELPAVLRRLNEQLPDQIRQGSLSEFFTALRARKPRLQRVRGELRSGKRALILNGVPSTRIYLKQRNAQVQTLLEAYAEPLAAFSHLLGGLDQRPFLREAWKILLHNQHHDAICGTSTDPIHRAMLTRFDAAEQLAEEVVREALEAIGTQLQTEDSVIPILVYNPCGWRRTGEVSILVDPVLEVFDGNATYPAWREADLRPCALEDQQGRSLPFSLTGEELASEDLLNGVKHRYKRRLLFQAHDLPPFGYRIYRIKLVREESPPPPMGEPVLVGKYSLENEFVRVEVAQDGTLNLIDKRTGQGYERLHSFEDEGDAGDEYNYSPPERQKAVSAQEIRVEVAEETPWKAALKIEGKLVLPRELSLDRRGRCARGVVCPFTSWVSLGRGARRVEIRTVFINKAKDHRLRVKFPTGVQATEAIAEDAFGVVRRPTRLPEGGKDWLEQPSPTHPQKRFVAVEDGQRGLAILNRGLPEYQAEEDGTIYLTLLRAIGWLSRDDLKLRQGEPAGPTYEVPDAQCPGVHTFDYAIVPYAGQWKQARLWQEAIEFNAPLRGIQVLPKGGSLPKTASFLQVSPDDLVVSAVKPAEEGEGVIVRMFNIGNRSIRGRIESLWPLQRAWVTNLGEDLQEELSLSGSMTGVITVRSGEVKTIGILPSPHARTMAKRPSSF
jgi:alpha-mannosidase